MSDTSQNTVLASQQNKNLQTHPDILQNRASNPESSVWVGASAGSGKTKVLTDRILRLLLPNQHGINACLPHKILALTFTKAAASEMALRINKRLSEWAVMPLDGKKEDGEKGLREDLQKLLGHEPSDIQIEAARKIFAVVVDTPGGLKIMTIHSFCQSILGRFPLEADLSPSFSALEEDQAAQFLMQAQQQVFKKSQSEKGSPLHQAIHHIALHQNEDQFTFILKNLMSERRQLNDILKKNFGTEGLYNALCQQLNIPAGLSKDELLHQVCEDEGFDAPSLWDACKALSTGSQKDIERGQKIQKWLEHNPKKRVENFEDFYQIFITQKETIRKPLATKKVTENHPDILQNLQDEAARLLEIKQQIDAIKISTLTRDLFIVGDAILKQFEKIKENLNTLDFDDLILKTLDLLQGQTKPMKDLDVTPWVRYKLDQGIDHLLVDEAQDTNPEQWEIIKALSDDFFSTQDDDINRSLFVVGDQKQSIFSFQRASPEKFIDMRQWFETKITSNNKPFENIQFNVSFRSTKSILTLVDHIFARPDLKEGLDEHHDIEHQSFRYTQAGHIELWPIFKSPKKEDFNPWQPPTEIIESSSGASQMATHIGQTIQKWIDEKEILASYDRPIEAGDIMILVRSRNAFIDQLVRALKIRNIPVSGVDRMVLSQQLVVQDLCAAAQFALLPEDDLNLACLLKSPFIGLGEEELFKLCHDRQNNSVWQSVKENADNAIISWLENLIQIGGKVRPFEFFEHILQHPCPADRTGLVAIKARLGDECLDPLNEFLNKSLQFEDDNIPTLQQFIQAQLHNDSQIKRQMEEGGNAVRIMTIHAAKGLQAPIVILPDTTRTPTSVKPERLLWPDRSGESLPYFCPQSKNLPLDVAKAMGVLKKRQNEEYRRLLYVALTRAEERLYIGGYQGRVKIMDECWYNYIKYGFETLDDVKTIQNGDIEIQRYTNPITDKPDRKDKPTKMPRSSDAAQNTTPAWLFKNVKQEQAPTKPLSPSRPSEIDMPALSPLKANEDHRFLRGNITHKLLQILPDLPIENRRTAAQKYVQQTAHDISTKIQKSIIGEVFNILENKEFSNIFGSQSMAEVPITGTIGDQVISGQIDRLLITDDEIFIIDYKSNRPPPKDVQDVPTIYIKQMKAYADIMNIIYPNRKIRSALIWTDGAELMKLPDL